MNTIAHLPTPKGRRKAAATAAVDAVEQLSARASTRRKAPRKDRAARKARQADLPATRPIKCGSVRPSNVVWVKLFRRPDSRFWQVSLRFSGHQKRLSTRLKNKASASAFAELAYRQFRRDVTAARADGVEADIRFSGGIHTNSML